MFKSLFAAPVDYTTAMDELQFARQRAAEGRARLPEDSSSWSDEQWAVYDRLEAMVPTQQYYDNPDCVCRGIVTAVNLGGYMWVDLKLDPPPRHPALPKGIRVFGNMEVQTRSDFAKLRALTIGQRAEIRGTLYPPMSYISSPDEAGTGEYFRLKMSSEYRRRRGY